MNDNLNKIPTHLHLFNFAKENGLEATAKLLRQYVLEGQPYDFCKGRTTKFMCKIASNGVEGLECEDSQDFRSSKYGQALFHYMWGNNESWEPEEPLSAEEFEELFQQTKKINMTIEPLYIFPDGTSCNIPSTDEDVISIIKKEHHHPLIESSMIGIYLHHRGMGEDVKNAFASMLLAKMESILKVWIPNN